MEYTSCQLVRGTGEPSTFSVVWILSTFDQIIAHVLFYQEYRGLKKHLSVLLLQQQWMKLSLLLFSFRVVLVSAWLSVSFRVVLVSWKKISSSVKYDISLPIVLSSFASFSFTLVSSFKIVSLEPNSKHLRKLDSLKLHISRVGVGDVHFS